jgi:predicted lipid-binding transport protein (Tim44 family)
MIGHLPIEFSLGDERMFVISGFKRALAVVVGLAAIGLVSADFAQAKVGSGSSSGSRGAKTYSAPPTTNTAPKAAAPMDRSMTTPGQANKAGGATAAAATAAAKPSMFGGMKGLLLGGLIGAGLASMFGAGAFANVLGFVLQAALIGGVLFLAYTFFRNRFGGGAPALATAQAGPAPVQRPLDANFRAASALSGSGAPSLVITPDDFNTFERLLGQIQTAYGRNDTKALNDLVTPEMLSYFAGDLAANAKKGVRNEISEPKLLQGDLAESWSEPNDDYATVAMRFSLLDRMVDVASGRIISGSATMPQESTELWTFRRPRSGPTRFWELSAIQQA